MNILYGFVVVHKKHPVVRIFSAGIGIDVQRTVIITLDDILFGFHACSIDIHTHSINQLLVNPCVLLRHAGEKHQEYQDRLECYYFSGKVPHVRLPLHLLHFLDNAHIHDPCEDLHKIGIELLARTFSELL